MRPGHGIHRGIINSIHIDGHGVTGSTFQTTIAHSKTKTVIGGPVLIAERCKGQFTVIDLRPGYHIVQCHIHPIQLQATHTLQTSYFDTGQAVAGIHVTEIEICRRKRIGGILIGNNGVVGRSGRFIDIVEIDRNRGRSTAGTLRSGYRQTERWRGFIIQLRGIIDRDRAGIGVNGKGIVGIASRNGIGHGRRVCQVDFLQAGCRRSIGQCQYRVNNSTAYDRTFYGVGFSNSLGIRPV